MAKWSGIIGFSNQKQVLGPNGESTGIWEENVIEFKYYGDIFKNTKAIESGSQINDQIRISNQISFVADPYARLNFHRILYATFMGIKWKVNNVEVQFPRIIVNLGGEYNEE